MRVAVVGAGVSGISAAWHLDQAGVETHLFERASRLGGHTHTHDIEIDGHHERVDTGFIVLNEPNYPELLSWFKQLGVEVGNSDMSFAVSDRAAGMEYGTADLAALLGPQILRLRYWQIWRDMLRFYRHFNDKKPAPQEALGDFLSREGYSKAFQDWHLLPMCAALWSQTTDAALDLSLNHIVEFMRNHCMLQVNNRPPWMYVKGGSDAYVHAFQSRFSGKIHLDRNISVSRKDGRGIVHDQEQSIPFDAIVMACHSDQALAVLEQPTSSETRVLDAFPYQKNTVYLHSDSSFMPRRRSAWSSWNVVKLDDGAYCTTYWMNRLQNLNTEKPILVTLNPPETPHQTLWSGDYFHPHFTQRSDQAKSALNDVNHRPTYFAGAYWGYGFHEDGFRSGRVCANQIIEDFRCAH